MADVIDQQKTEEARQMLDGLYEKMDSKGLDAFEQTAFDVLSWLLDGTDKPEFD